MAKLVIVVEGCLDAALASHLARVARVDAEVAVARGKSGVARLVASLSAATATPVIGIVDADEDSLGSLAEAARLAGLGAQRPVLHECGSAGVYTVRRGGVTLAVWCDAWSGCRRGTVEDVVLYALREVYGCGAVVELEGCGGCPGAAKAERIASKLLAPLSAAACAGRGTLVATRYEKYCGVDLEEVFDELGLGARSAVLRCYAELITASSSRGTSSAPR